MEFSFFKNVGFFKLILETEEGRERGTAIFLFLFWFCWLILECVLTGDQTCNLSVSGQRSNPLSRPARSHAHVLPGPSKPCPLPSDRPLCHLRNARPSECEKKGTVWCGTGVLPLRSPCPRPARSKACALGLPFLPPSLSPLQAGPCPPGSMAAGTTRSLRLEVAPGPRSRGRAQDPTMRNPTVRGGF